MTLQLLLQLPNYVMNVSDSSLIHSTLKKLNTLKTHNTLKQKKLIYKQLNTIFENKLSPLLCGFHARYSTQHTLLNLINKWHSCLDNSGVVSRILMGLSKAFGCIPHELILLKLDPLELT